jgi:hypothetical protein
MSSFAPVIAALFLLSGCKGIDDPTYSQLPPEAPINAIWGREDLYEGQAATFIAPNNRMTLDYRGKGVLISNGRGATIRLDVVPPASVLWRPDGNGVAINNGDGSGQFSHLIIVSNGTQLSTFKNVEPDLKDYFFKHTGCRIDPDTVSVSAEGWSADSSKIWVRFESWDRQTLCESDSVAFALYDISKHAVVMHESVSKAFERFCTDNGFRQEYQPNCNDYERRSSAKSDGF